MRQLLILAMDLPFLPHYQLWPSDHYHHSISQGPASDQGAYSTPKAQLWAPSHQILPIYSITLKQLAWQNSRMVI